MINKSNAKPATPEQIEQIKTKLRPATRSAAPAQMVDAELVSALKKANEYAVKHCGKSVSVRSVARATGISEYKIRNYIYQAPQKSASANDIAVIVAEYNRQISAFLQGDVTVIAEKAAAWKAVISEVETKISDIQKLIQQ